MPLILEGVGGIPLATAPGRGGGARSLAGAARGRLHIGLVNNMPDAALKPTERQFARMLAAASGPVDVRLHLFSLAEVPRRDAARSHLRERYGDLAALERARLDGLIVTGAEPVAPSLADEPYWNALTRVVDWAEHNTTSTIWSCLAAHAAVLHLDGIARQRLPQKRFGLFECVKVADAGMLQGAPAGMRIPHSRWNDLPEGELRRHGYRIESRSPEAGIDTFTKQWGSLFVFLQGHPEYDVDTLFREYRRDVQRFLGGERHELPAAPSHYFDARTEGAAAAFARAAAVAREPDAWERFPREWSIRPDLVGSWQATAARFYGNWLSHVAAAR